MTKSYLRSALYSIVLRCSVYDSNENVLEYAKSRLKRGHWEKQTPEWKAAFAMVCEELHTKNLNLYRTVMKGTL